MRDISRQEVMRGVYRTTRLTVIRTMDPVISESSGFNAKQWLVVSVGRAMASS